MFLLFFLLFAYCCTVLCPLPLGRDNTVVNAVRQASDLLLTKTSASTGTGVTPSSSSSSSSSSASASAAAAITGKEGEEKGGLSPSALPSPSALNLALSPETLLRCGALGSRAAGALAAACSSMSVAERERGLGALRVILKEEVGNESIYLLPGYILSITPVNPHTHHINIPIYSYLTISPLYLQVMHPRVVDGSVHLTPAIPHISIYP